MNQDNTKEIKIMFYLDSDVYINTIKDEGNRTENTDIFLMNCCLEKKLFITLIISETLISEVIGVANHQNLNIDNHLFNLLVEKGKIKYVKPNQADIELAKELWPEHYKDMLHYIIAINEKVDYILTNNVPDFNNAKYLYHLKFLQINQIPIKLPREGIKILKELKRGEIKNESN